MAAYETHQSTQSITRNRIPNESTLIDELWVSTELLFQSRLTWLLLLGPVALLGDASGVLGEPICFAFSGIALIPCAERLSFVTEQVAAHTNGTIGALLNATFGNAPELLISTAALRSGFYRVLQLAMLGSQLMNLLFVFGVSCLVGGLRWQVQELRITSGNVSVGMLLVATAGSLLPTALILGGQLPTKTDNEDIPSKEELQFSRVNAVVMMFMYICYLTFQLGTHKDEFDEDENVVEAPDGRMLLLSPHFIARNGRKKRGARRNVFCQCFFGKTQHHPYQPVDVDEEAALGDMEIPSVENMSASDSNSTLSENMEIDRLLYGKQHRLAGAPSSGGVLSSSQARRGCSRSPPTSLESHSEPGLKHSTRSQQHAQALRNGLKKSKKSRSLDNIGQNGLGKDSLHKRGGKSGNSKLGDTDPPSAFTSADSQQWSNKSNSHHRNSPDGDSNHGGQMSFRAGLVWLLIITLCISAMSDILVDTIDGFAYRLRLSEVFTSMIIVPFFSNVAEQVSAIIFAYRNEMDLCVGVTVGSAIQISTFVLPGCVLIGMMFDHSLSLHFRAYESACLLIGVICVAAVLQGGTTNWLVGATLIGIYVMIAAGFWFHELENLSVDAEIAIHDALD